MGRMKKKGEEGQAKEYISRAKAIRRLQVSLADFRRLCILKGIYPREPPNKKKVSGSTANRTYYFAKDINWLLHEPLLLKFRDLKIFARKIKRAEAKVQPGIVERVRANRPLVKVQHLVRERYPTFIDAVRDLDDCLCLLFLFANFPKHSVISTELAAKCRRLSNEFLIYVIRTRALRKVFLSIKGIYYQADILGQTVTWIAPYKFSTDVPADVDYRVMGTFLQFYTTMMGFVNYKLYASLDLKYPPKVIQENLDNDLGLAEFMIQTTSEFAAAEAEVKAAKAAQRKINKQKRQTASRVAQALQDIKSMQDKDDDDEDSDDEQDTEAQEVNAEAADEPMLDTFPEQADGGDESSVPQIAAIETAAKEVESFTKLFDGLYFFLSREVPRYSLEFVIASFGGNVSWEGTGDVGAGPYSAEDARITHHIADRPSLSQTFDGRHYVQPQWVYDCINARTLLPTADYVLGAVLPSHLSPFVEEGADDYMPAERRAQLAAAKDIHSADLQEDEIEEDDEDREEIYQKELQDELGEDAEAAPKPKRSKKVSKAQQRKDEEKEATELQRLMMTGKNRKLYSRIMHGKKKKQREAAKLESKRKALQGEEPNKKKKGAK
eukprot:m.72326 g.72326  ORF g.72326 m.72326 type:complete len:609 (-) comp14251_c0_seq2:128-1954(-)